MHIPAIGTTLSSLDAQKLCVDLAYLGGNRVSPNPMVGSVLLDKSYKLISFGYHEFYGGPHAEVNTLNKIKPKDAEGGHLFVSLEPCSHYGKTPPCSNLVSTYPLESITYGLQDPNPLVSGKGIYEIQKSGIKIYKFDETFKDDLNELLEFFLFHLKNESVFYVLKVASTLDSIISDSNKNSKWITSQEAREHVHFMRSKFQGILIGKNTLILDNPSLTIRHKNLEHLKNKVIILNSSADLLDKITEFKVYKLRPPEDIILCVDLAKVDKHRLNHIESSVYVDKKIGIHIVGLKYFNSNTLCLKMLSENLKLLNISDVYVEGGAKIYSSFIEQELFDQIHLYQAPTLLGNFDNTSWTSSFSKTIDVKVNLDLLDVKKIGKDLFTKWVKANP